MSRGVRLAAIDVGSNAARLKVAIHKSTGELKIIDRGRTPIGLGGSVYRNGAIDAPALSELVSVLAGYLERCRAHGARPRAIGTAALREAENRDEVLAEIERRLDLTIEVVSGEEEARLICVGVLDGTDAQTESICLDIGGGSTELVIARGDRPVALHSAKIGSIRLAERDGASGVVAMRASAKWAVNALPPGPFATTVALGCSGTLRAVIDFAGAGEFGLGGGPPSIGRNELNSSIDRLIRLGISGRKSLFGEPRAQTIVAGAIILEQVMERLGLTQVVSTKRGLRDGVLIDTLRKQALWRPLRLKQNRS